MHGTRMSIMALWSIFLSLHTTLALTSSKHGYTLVLQSAAVTSG
jgi:hypothetical protein